MPEINNKPGTECYELSESELLEVCGGKGKNFEWPHWDFTPKEPHGKKQQAVSYSFDYRKSMETLLVPLELVGALIY